MNAAEIEMLPSNTRLTHRPFPGAAHWDLHRQPQLDLTTSTTINLEPAEDGTQVELECRCGCTRTFSVPVRFLDESSTRVKPEHKPPAYYKDHGDFGISGSTGYLYASLRCLNSVCESD
jgi:hypothetical protein